MKTCNRMIVPVGFVAGGLAVAAAWLCLGGASENEAGTISMPEWKDFPYTRPEHGRRMNLICNVLPAKAEWSPADVDFVLQVLSQQLPDYRSPEANSLDTPLDRRVELAEPGEEYAMAEMLVRQAIRAGKAMPPAELERLRHSVVRALYDAHPTKRRGSIPTAKETGMFDDPLVRARIEQLRDDLDQGVSLAAQNHLRHYLAVKSVAGRAEADCPTCPKRAR